MGSRIVEVVRFCVSRVWKSKRMSRDLQQRFDVLVVGGGPAGMAAAVRAAECGVRVGIVDDNVTLGGQIWRGESEDGPMKDAAKWNRQLRTADVTTLCGMRVFHQPEPGILLAEGADNLMELSYRNLVLATGARERFLPFPGWTLPNVMGAGGLQAMVKSGLPIRGKRVVVAGTGPLLLAVAAYLREHGAEIPVICEQASWRSLARFGVVLLRQPGKIVQGLKLKKSIAGVPFLANCWPVAAHGRNALQSVTIARGGKRETIACDYLACGFHLVPNIELPRLLGCKSLGGYVEVDSLQQTTVKGVFCAGEPTSIGGVELSLVEGQIAGLAAAGNEEEARMLFDEREKSRRFVRVLSRTFCLRRELKSLSFPDTVVCRCEDISYSRLEGHRSWRAAKLHTRCGMGPCQGRVCGPAVQFLFKWNPDSVRPPVFPARVENLAAFAGRPNAEHSAIRGGS
jgi:NADPH-dependent 2,4-dienoyl-CoA reductase/sulfur reductase-like enzyme